MSTLKVNNLTDLGDDPIVTDGALIGAGKILQVVRGVDSTQRTTTSSAFVDTGLSVTITPTSATSTILVQWFGIVRTSASSGASYASLAITDSSDTKLQGAQRMIFGDGDLAIYGPVAMLGYDSPATTSATTYKARFRINSGASIFLDNDQSTATLIAYEVAG